MRKILPVLFVILSIIMVSCVSVDPHPGALDPTSLPVIVTANEPQKTAPKAAPQPPTAEPSPTTEPTPEIAKELLECSTKFSEWEKSPEAPFSVIMSDEQTKAIEDAGLLKPMDKSKIGPFPTWEFNTGALKTSIYTGKEPFLKMAHTLQNIDVRPMRAICIKKVSDMDGFVVFMQVATDDPSAKDGYVLLRVFMYDVRKLQNKAIRALEISGFSNRMKKFDASGGYMIFYYDLDMAHFDQFPTSNHAKAAFMADALLAQGTSKYVDSASTVKQILAGHATKTNESTPFIGGAMLY
jgi:hypothetical protein